MINKKNLDRREFMKLLAKGSAAGALGSLGQMALMNEAVAAAPGFADYKALVCVFFHGGNDSFNMLIPSEASEHANYKSIRGGLAVENNDLNLASIASNLHSGTLGKGAANPYNVNSNQQRAYTKGIYDLSSKGINLGVNGVMPEFAQLITENKVSVIANVGNLVSPVTRTQVKNGTANLPLFLFAHDHQQRALQTGNGDNLDDIGWAGKIADSWAGINNNSSLGLNISYAGNNRILIGNQTSPLVLSPGSPPYFSGMKKDGSRFSNERRALFNALSGIAAETSTTTLNLVTTAFTDSNPFKRLYSDMSNRSRTNFDSLNATWNDNPISYSTKGPYGEELFEKVSAADLGFSQDIDGGFIKQLEAVSKMIDLGAKDAFATGNYKRQIFYVGMGGFDNHTNQSNNHSKLLREMSLGLWKFQKAMEELGHEKKVTTFSMSDFGRSMSNNGGGTDHAWGAHHFVMGGAGDRTSGNLNGGNMIGKLPDLSLDGTDDHGNKGRIIPTQAQDQLNASICEWFGVEESLISTIFPNVSNFETTPGDVKSAFLNDLFVS